MENFDKSLIGKAFDGEQADVLIKFTDSMGSVIDQKSEKAVFDALEKRGIDKEVLGLSDVEKAALKLKKQVAKVKRIVDNNGWLEGYKDRIEISDLLAQDARRREDWLKNEKKLDSVFSTDQPLLLPRVIDESIRMPIEPNIVLTPLLKRINVPKAGSVLTFPAIGNAFKAHDLGEGQEYREAPTLELSGEVVAKMGKSGIAVKVSEETMRYSMYDVLSLQVKMAGAALQRLKEEKVARLIFEEGGVTFFDNSGSTAQTSGLNASGARNNTITIDDILLMYADMVNDGFIPDTMIVHPFQWYGFARDPIMRHLFMQGQGGFFYQTFQGSIGSPNGSFAGGGLMNKNYFSDPQQLATTYQLPSILPTPLRVIVTPYQTCDPTTGTGTITVCKSDELGMMLVDEDVTSEEWHEPQRDIKKIKWRERYALALSSNGQAIRHAKNVNWRDKPYAINDYIMSTWQAGTGAVQSSSQPTLGV